jgi:ankyrin repeat protein
MVMKNIMILLLLLAILLGMTACTVNILTAAENGNMEAVDKAISRGDDVNERDNNGNTPLILAAKHGDFAIVKELVMRGANLKIKNNDSYDALLALANYTMQYPLEVGKGKKKNEQIPVTTEGHLKTAAYLIQNGANVNEMTRDGNTALILAANLNKLKLVKLLLSKGAGVNAQNQKGDSALIVASTKGYAELICPLIRKGADTHLKDNEGKTALQYAERYDQQEIIKILNTPCPPEPPDTTIASGADNKSDDRLVDKLIEALTDKDPSVRWEAAQRLGDLKDRRAVVPLIRSLSDIHPYVRRRAAFALGELHDPRAIDSLIRALQDDDVFVQKLASEALEKITGQQFGSDSKKWTDWWALKIRQY